MAENNNRFDNDLLIEDIRFLLSTIACRWQSGLRDGLNKNYDDYVKDRLSRISKKYLGDNSGTLPGRF